MKPLPVVFSESQWFPREKTILNNASSLQLHAYSTDSLRNLLFFENKWLLYLTYQTIQICLKKTKLAAVVKDLGAVKGMSFINKIFIICLGR